MGGGSDSTQQTGTSTTTTTPSPALQPLINLAGSLSGQAQPLYGQLVPLYEDFIRTGVPAPFLGPAYTGIDEEAQRELRWVDHNIPPGGQREQMRGNIMDQAGARRINLGNQARMAALQGGTRLAETLSGQAISGLAAASSPLGTMTTGQTTTTQPGGSKFGF